MKTTRRALATLLLVIASLSIICAQGQDKNESKSTAALSITIAGNSERVRFTAPGSVMRMHIEVYAETGETLFDSNSKGNVFDWSLSDSTGQRLADGSYLCVVTAKTLSGKLSQRLGTVSVQGKQVSVRGTQGTQLSAGQQQWVGPVEENAALIVLQEDDVPSATVVAHDGQNGQVTSTVGALTFRTGDLFSGKEQEGMRLTTDGNVGIGTDTPEARLDVNGMIRARQGFQFADGSVLNLSPKGGGLRITLPSGKTATVSLSPSAVAGTANYLPKFASDGTSLLDSAIYQDPSTGFIGIGTTTPAHPFVVRRNGGSLGVHSVGELFVDRDDRSRSASLTVGTAGVLKWIFGMPSGQDGFQVYDLTNNVSRFFVDPANGNIGMGTNSPGTRLDVVGALNLQGIGGAPAVAPAGQGRLFFSSVLNKFQVSQNGSPYVDLIGGGGLTLPFSASQSSASTLFSLTNTGDGGAGTFAINSNAANGANALTVTSNNNFAALKVTNTGVGHAADFRNENAGSGLPTLFLQQLGVGKGFEVQHNGSNGQGATITLGNGSNPATALEVSTNGTGDGAVITSQTPNATALKVLGGKKGLVIQTGALVLGHINQPSGTTLPPNSLVVRVLENGGGTAVSITLPDPNTVDAGTIIYIHTSDPQGVFVFSGATNVGTVPANMVRYFIRVDTPEWKPSF
jgi:hypothetical protein